MLKNSDKLNQILEVTDLQTLTTDLWSEEMSSVEESSDNEMVDDNNDEPESTPVASSPLFPAHFFPDIETHVSLTESQNFQLPSLSFGFSAPSDGEPYINWMDDSNDVARVENAEQAIGYTQEEFLTQFSNEKDDEKSNVSSISSKDSVESKKEQESSEQRKDVQSVSREEDEPTIRLDLAFKTVNRSLKKFMSKEYKRTHEWEGIKASERKVVYKDNILDFAGKFVVEMEEDAQIAGVSPTALKYFIAFLVNPSLMKKLHGKPRSLCKLTLLYNTCINCFTHSCNKRLWRSSLFRLIFQWFYRTRRFDAFCDEDPIIQQHPDEYKSSVPKLFELPADEPQTAPRNCM